MDSWEAGSSKKDLSRDIEVRFGNALKSTVPIRSSYQVSTLGSKRYDTVALEAHGAHDQAPARIGDLQLEQLQAHRWGMVKQWGIWKLCRSDSLQLCYFERMSFTV